MEQGKHATLILCLKLGKSCSVNRSKAVHEFTDSTWCKLAGTGLGMKAGQPFSFQFYSVKWGIFGPS